MPKLFLTANICSRGPFPPSECHDALAAREQCRPLMTFEDPDGEMLKLQARPEDPLRLRLRRQTQAMEAEATRHGQSPCYHLVDPQAP